MIFFGDEDYVNVLEDKENYITDLKIKHAQNDNYLFKIMIDYMLLHRDKKNIEFKLEDKE